MKQTIKILLTVLIALSLSCSDNYTAKHFGGKVTVEIPSDRKFLNVTWKETSLWVLTRPRKSGETQETFEFKEDNAYGFLNGTVEIVEK